jgi:hypothetical protein
VYRATTHGFGAKAFHERCDWRARLLVLVRAQEGGWLFGGFTAVGFSPPDDDDYDDDDDNDDDDDDVECGFIADSSAFLFSLTNSLGRPEKLASKGTGQDLHYSPYNYLAAFGGAPDFLICDDADRRADSYTDTGYSYAAPASTGAHPMAQGTQDGWKAAEIVAWSV